MSQLMPVVCALSVMDHSMGMYLMDDLVHEAKLYRTNGHYKHFWKEYIFLNRCVWKIFGRSSSYFFWMNVYEKYLDRLLVCIFFDS
ncbi:unnamed protein product [Camellia sinensis]